MAMLSWKKVPGWRRLAPMPPTRAARWHTRSGFVDANRRPVAPRSRRSTSDERGATTSVAPRARNKETTCEPRKPPPPVTRTLRTGVGPLDDIVAGVLQRALAAGQLEIAGDHHADQLLGA